MFLLNPVLTENTKGEEIGHKYGGSISLPKNAQNLIKLTKHNKTTTKDDSLTYSWNWKVDKGKITVNKKGNLFIPLGGKTKK